MIRDAYYEESAACGRAVKEAKVYLACNIISIIFLVFAGIQFFLAFSNIAAAISSYHLPEGNESAITGAELAYTIISWVLFVLAPLAVGLALFFFKRKFNQSYDYAFVEDELRVAKVYNGKKRKYLKTFKCDQILKIGKCENESFERTCAGFSKKQIVFLTPNRVPAEEKNFYYILYSSSIEKTVNIVEARVELIDLIVRAAGRSKWEAR